MSEIKKEFLQKYMLDSYSRAIPTNSIPGNQKATLGEYSDPVDSCKGQEREKRHTEDSDDSDPGYALPQDALDTQTKQRNHSSSMLADTREDDNQDVYELAHNSHPEGYDVPPPKKTSPKPSPKPRASAYRQSQTDEQIKHKESCLTKAPSWEGQDLRRPSLDSAVVLTADNMSGKKVVEIDYECASGIQYQNQNNSQSVPKSSRTSSASSSPSPPFANRAKGHHSHQTKSGTPSQSPNHRRSSLPQYSMGTQVNPPTISSAKVTSVAPTSVQQDFVYSMSQPIASMPTQPETMYEEPWDLKARRLKQEKEEVRMSKASEEAKKVELEGSSSAASSIVAPPGMIMLPGSPGGPSKSSGQQIAHAESIYEDAWDTVAQQKKLEARLSYARSLSTTSDTADIFHDALDNLPKQKSFSQANLPPVLAEEPILNPVPGDTYEDAWDLKNSMLNQKIRQMQVEASATYEEPWDLKRQNQQLQARLSFPSTTTTTTNMNTASITTSSNTRTTTSSSNNINDGDSLASGGPRRDSGASRRDSGASKIVKQRSSEGCDQSWSGGSASESPLSRAKNNSVDDSSRTKAKMRGCNIGQRINPIIPLANQNWYHGNISRDDAEKMLRVCKEGSYIVRISSDRKSYSLSIKSAKQNIHVQIEQVGLLDGSVRYILGKNSKEFCSIPEMIDYYTHHRVPLKGAEHITLLHPVECKWSSNSPS